MVIGAGVVGLAVARQLALSGRHVMALEAEPSFGTETSSRNSEVIHAGIYYRLGSWKAKLCVPGKEMLYAYCEERGIPHKRCGKLIVATNQDQEAELGRIMESGCANGLTDLEVFDLAAVRSRAPALNALAAIWSPSTGIVDSHQLMLAFLGDLENAGGTLVTGARVLAIDASLPNIRLKVASGGISTIEAKTVVNCAGLGAVPLAQQTEGLSPVHIPSVAFAKGSYFSYGGATPFDCLVYPVPTPGGLGIHLTLDQSGSARFGPDVEWVDTVDYAVDASKKDNFVRAVADYWPGVQAEKMHPAYSGIRIKVGSKEDQFHDFEFSGPADHGVSGLVNLFGMESPGLTSCLAIARHVANLVQ